MSSKHYKESDFSLDLNLITILLFYMFHILEEVGLLE